MKPSVKIALEDLLSATKALEKIDALYQSAVAVKRTDNRLSPERDIYKVAIEAGMLEWMKDFAIAYFDACGTYEAEVDKLSIDIDATLERLRNGIYTLDKIRALGPGIARSLKDQVPFASVANPVLEWAIVFARNGKEQINDYLDECYFEDE